MLTLASDTYIPIYNMYLRNINLIKFHISILQFNISDKMNRFDSHIHSTHKYVVHVF